MEKISINNLVDFRRKSERSRLTFVNNLKKDKKNKPDESGGDYWVSCISAINDVFKSEDSSLIDKKVEELQNRIKETEYKNTKDRWQKNINILESFRDFNYKSIKPSSPMSFNKKIGLNSILNIEGLPIESKPQHVFSYTNDGCDELGAVWFIVKKDGYSKSELGMFCDIIYRNLAEIHSDKFNINPKYCVAVDAFKWQAVNYNQLLNGDIPYLLETTVDEIKNYFQP